MTLLYNELSIYRPLLCLANVSKENKKKLSQLDCSDIIIDKFETTKVIKITVHIYFLKVAGS